MELTIVLPELNSINVLITLLLIAISLFFYYRNQILNHYVKSTVKTTKIVAPILKATEGITTTQDAVNVINSVVESGSVDQAITVISKAGGAIITGNAENDTSRIVLLGRGFVSRFLRGTQHEWVAGEVLTEFEQVAFKILRIGKLISRQEQNPNQPVPTTVIKEMTEEEVQIYEEQKAGQKAVDEQNMDDLQRQLDAAKESGEDE